MHELSLARTLVETLAEQAKAHGFARVLRVQLEIGELGHVDPDALAFGFDVVTRGTLAEGAALDIVRSTASARCPACGTEVVIATRVDPCPRCGGVGLVVTRGEELRITELEVA